MVLPRSSSTTIIPLAWTILAFSTSCSEGTSPDVRGITPGRAAAALSVDPDPSRPGIFIPGVAPSTCYADVGAITRDYDHDWLDDNCEYELARAFAPRLLFGDNETCLGREPVWAAKYFDDARVVRIAYMPAYYQDCGMFPQDRHEGDSEFIMIEVWFEAAFQHWVFLDMWLSAHYKSPGFDRSRWVGRDATQFPEKYLGFPQVWVSEKKHANYATWEMCHNVDWESRCAGNWYGDGRERVDADRNAGSRFVDFLGCITSRDDAIRITGGRCETFYIDRPFRGWAAYETGGQSSPYRRVLMSDKFELRVLSSGTWGPGPHPPGWQPPHTASIIGPREGRAGDLCHWFLSTNVTPPQIEWFVDGELVGTGGDQWYNVPASSFTLAVFVKGGGGAAANDAIPVYVSGNTCASEEW